MKLFDELGGPFDLIFGLPVHPLVVHSSVVLVPLVAFAGIAMSYIPSFSRRYGKVILILALVAQVSLFVAKLSGESFEERLGKNIERHADCKYWFTDCASTSFYPARCGRDFGTRLYLLSGTLWRRFRLGFC
ncbi:MAG: hypothetical protein EBX19_06385 [Actinobacteria bacterium]|nr:hypothetical protein [Actinomycetota bacterium]